MFFFFFCRRNVSHKHSEQHDSKKRTATGWNNHLVQRWMTNHGIWGYPILKQTHICEV